MVIKLHYAIQKWEKGVTIAINNCWGIRRKKKCLKISRKDSTARVEKVCERFQNNVAS